MTPVILHALQANRRLAGRVVKRLTPPQVNAQAIKPQLEKAVFGFGLINPVLALPQLYNIYVFKHVAGLSLITIASALIMALLWTAYGALGRQRVVWATSAVWVVVHGATLAGVAILSS